MRERKRSAACSERERELLSYGPLLAVEQQTWCGTVPPCRQLITHLYGALGDTTYSRDETAKSHPFGSNTLHLLPVERLCNLVATQPAAVGVEWSNHVWDPFSPVFLVNRQASLSVSSLSLLKGMCTPLVCVLWILYIEFHDCLRDLVCSEGRHTDSLSPLLCHRFVRSLRWVLAWSASPLTWTAAAACPINTSCADLGHKVYSKVWSLSITCQTLRSLLLSHLLLEALSWCILHRLCTQYQHCSRTHMQCLCVLKLVAVSKFM